MSKRLFPFVVAVFVTLLPACKDSSGPDVDAATLTLVKLSEDSLSAPFGTVLPLGPTVEVRNAAGEVVGGVPVHFSVALGGGFVSPGSSETDGQGRASAIWVLGYAAGGGHTLRARIDGDTVYFTASTFEPTTGNTYYGRQEYIQYMPGDLPLVISAPHGGDLRPDEIPDRTWGTLGQDRNTRDLALRIRDAVFEQTGGYPHLILSNLHRVKLDPNREINEAAQGNFLAERAWWEFQQYIETGKHLVVRDFQDGLYIDLHGHGHDNPRVELGYLLSSSTLALPDEVLSSSEYSSLSSLRTLAQKTAVPFSHLLRGIVSLGGGLEGGGFPAVPSPSQPHPGGEPYFSGGYNTLRHGSVEGGAISGVQIECHYPGLRDEAENRESFAAALTRTLKDYFRIHYGRELAPLAAPVAAPTPW